VLDAGKVVEIVTHIGVDAGAGVFLQFRQYTAADIGGNGGVGI